MIQAITFDLDDTFWPIAPVIQRANRLLLQWLQEHAPAFTSQFDLDGLNALRDEVMTCQPELCHDLSQVRQALLLLGLQRSGYQGAQAEQLAAQAFEIFFIARNQVALFDHVESTLHHLQQYYRLGTLSNGNADLKHIGLDHLFEFSFNAAAICYAKPHRAMFNAVLNHTGLQPHQVVHVGDHPEHDVLGAQEIGMRCVWMNPEECAWPGLKRPDAEIHDFSELPAAVSQLDCCAARKLS